MPEGLIIIILSFRRCAVDPRITPHLRVPLQGLGILLRVSPAHLGRALPKGSNRVILDLG